MERNHPTGDESRTREELLQELKELRRREETLRASEALLQKMVDSSSEILLILDASRKIRLCNRTFLDAFGFRDGAPAGKSIKVIYPSEISFIAYSEKIEAMIDGNGPVSTEWTLCRQNGQPLPAEIKTSLIKGADGHILNHVLSIRDLTAQKDQEAKLAEAVTHDALTGLPNRVLLFDRLSLAILQSRRRGQPFALMFMDLDHFNSVNHSFGRAAADGLLKAAGLRLCASLRREDTIAHMGGDEFVLVLADIGDKGNAVTVANKLLSAFRKPFTLDGVEVKTTLSIGIVLSPEDGDSPDELLRRANLAMYQVKETGRNGFECYSPDLDYQHRERG